MDLPPHIAERIRELVAATSTKGGHVDNEAARYGGIPLLGTIGSIWLLRPDGTVWDVDDDTGKVLQPVPETRHVLALVYGVERHRWLAELIPPRPESANECTTCKGRGRIDVVPPSRLAHLKADNYICCHACNGLGWTA